MKVGDMVRRFDEEARQELGIGLVVEIEPHRGLTSAHAVVMWANHGLSWETPEDLETMHESR